MAYLLLEQFQNVSQTPRGLDLSTGRNAFLEYSGNYWLLHTREGNVLRKHHVAYTHLCEVNSGTFKTWFLVWWRFKFVGPPPQNVTHLLLASIIMDKSLAIEALETKREDIEAADDVFGRTALLWASFNCHEEMVQLLLESGADTERRTITTRQYYLRQLVGGRKG